MNWIQRFLTAIATHKADVSAHHEKTVAGDINLADLAEKAHSSLTGIGASDHHTKTIPYTSGSYVGDGTDNLAIAHGLGATPKLVLIARVGATVDAGYVLDTLNVNLYDTTSSGVTGWNATYFYVKVAVVEFNGGGVTYNWVAFK